MDSDERRLPVIYFGHGNPMNAILENACTDGWRAIGSSLPRPRAILCISAHWYITSTRVTSMERPRTIHDFGGFPRELYEVQYPAPGDPVLAGRVVELLKPTEAILDDESWGLDHGTWSVLTHVFPDADIPVVQLSVDETQPPSFHYELGGKLAPLRGEGVLVIGSGNLVHNLHAYSWGRHPVEPFEWAVRFETEVRRLLEGHEHGPLVDYESLGPDALLSVPTPDHYLPLLRDRRVHRGRRHHLPSGRCGRRLHLDADRSPRVSSGRPRSSTWRRALHLVDDWCSTRHPRGGRG